MLRMEAVKGIYVPKGTRLAKKQEINRAHFSLGNDQQMPKKSYGQDLIEQSQDKAATNNGLMIQEAAERKKMVEMSRQSNFHIGEEAKMNSKTYAKETSSNVAYKFQKGTKSTTDVTKMDFKVANFKFGNQIPKYVTTNTDTYNEALMKDRVSQMTSENLQKAEMIRKNKMQKFVIGTEGPQFLTEAQKKYIKHDMGDLHKIS